jgi:hypothetical protein
MTKIIELCQVPNLSQNDVVGLSKEYATSSISPIKKVTLTQDNEVLTQHSMTDSLDHLKENRIISVENMKQSIESRKNPT